MITRIQNPYIACLRSKGWTGVRSRTAVSSPTPEARRGIMASGQDPMDVCTRSEFTPNESSSSSKKRRDNSEPQHPYAGFATPPAPEVVPVTPVRDWAHEYCDDHICCLDCRARYFCNDHSNARQAYYAECTTCGLLSECGEALHYHHDGCPVCDVDDRDPNHNRI